MWPWSTISMLRAELSSARAHASYMSAEVDTLATRLAQAEAQAIAYRDQCAAAQRKLARVTRQRDRLGRFVHC